ncbi:MAG: glycosyltransferase family 2 protein [Jatrophihabitantaceae bacterium]
MPLISVVTAVGPDDEKYLPTLVDSLKMQRLDDWELVISADGPTTAGRAYAQDDQRITWLNSATQNGPAAARNLALPTVRSPIFRNLDADDWLAGPDVLERTLAAFDHPNIDFVVGPTIDVLADGTERTFEGALRPGRIESGVLYQGWLANNHIGLVHPTTMAVRTSTLWTYGGYPALPSSEDTALLLRISQRTSGWLLDRPVTKHRQRAGSITSTTWHRDEFRSGRRTAFIRRICEPNA